MKKTIIILFLLFPLLAESKPVQRLRKLHRPSITPSVILTPSVNVSLSPSPTPSPSPSICIEPDVRFIN